jgi:peptide/nickel transport system permease protein
VSVFLTGLIDQLKQFNWEYVIEFWSTPMVHEGFFYSMKLLIASMLVVSVLGVILATIVHSMPVWMSKLMRKFLNLFEAFPDLLIIILLQMIVIYLYKETGIKFLKLFGIAQTPYLVPIFVLSIIPCIFMTQFFLKVIDTEANKDYVIMARSIGAGKARIMLTRILPNIFPFYLMQLKVLLWMLLSQIILVERIFALHGFSDVIRFAFFESGSYQYIFLSISAIILPLLVLDLVIKIMQRRNRGLSGL